MNNILPIELRYLFENQYIECIKILIVLYLHKRKKYGISMDEIVYYLTIAKCCYKISNDKYEIDFEYIQNNYLKNEKNIRKNIMILVNKELVLINYERTAKKDKLTLKITSGGIDIIKNLESEYFKEEIGRYSYLVKNMKYSAKNKKGVLFKYES